MTQETGQAESGASPGELSTPIPELRITQVLRSPEPVLRINPNNPVTSEMVRIQPVREYTVALAKGSDEIQVLDKAGRRVEGLSNTKTMILDWQALMEREAQGRSPYQYMAIDISTVAYNIRSQTKGVNMLPERERLAVTAYIKQKDTNNQNLIITPSSTWELGVNDIGSVQVKTEEGYVIFFQTDGISKYNWIGFQTKDERGVDLPPRNWKRFDLVDQWAGKCPTNIAAEVRHLNIQDLTTIQHMENGYYVLALKDRLAVMKPGQQIAEAEFTDQLVGIGNNVCQDPRNRGILYYCTSDNPRLLIKLDTTKDPANWVTETVDIPQEYKNIRNLSLEPTGNFFMFQSNGDFVILAKDTLQEVQKIPKLYEGKLDEQGRIRGVDEKGHLVIYEANFQEVTQELEKRRVAILAQGLATDLFKKEAATATKIEVEQFQHLVPVRTDLETKFADQLQTITSLDDISTFADALARLRTRLRSEGLAPGQISFITQGIQDSIRGKERLLAAPIVAQGLVDLNEKLAGNLTIASATEAKGDLAKLKSLENLVDDAARAQIRALESRFGQQSAELFRREGAVIEKDVGELVTGVSGELEKMISMPDFADWQEFRLPQLVSRLGSLANDCPLEASGTQKKILAARRQLQELSRRYESKFKERYAEVREKASEVMRERVELMKAEMESLVNRLRSRGFKDRSQVETYIRSSEALEALKSEIEELKKQNPDVAKELDKALKVQIATIKSEVERGGLTTVAETGQQMVLFGSTTFPRWEGKTKEKKRLQTNLIFIPDEKRNQGLDIPIEKEFGDVGIMYINSRGVASKVRLYEQLPLEDYYRKGDYSYRGVLIPPSYIRREDFRDFMKKYQDWSKGDDSKIRRALSEKRQTLKEWYQQRQPRGQRDSRTDDQWGARYGELLTEYANFAAENKVVLLSKLDQLSRAPDTEVPNGMGYVPDRQNHWTRDATTEHYLEEMAKLAKMQLDLQEGLVNLKGHAGTGKDVLVKMFCRRTNRPYFTVDCSKWTTEFELSEDVVLEAKDGASQTIKVPSAVLNAITTPGAVMYFNEINAMPEQAQIFLHSLMDEKRTLTLKTSSGRAIKTLPSVILMGSMNPGYPGTFKPQFATESRFIPIEINYPPLYRERDPNDPNPNPPISSAEALRVAREVDSFSDLTYEENPQYNDFVKIWDRYINGIQNGAPDLTPSERFDLEAILTLVEFGNKLREGFILKFEQARASAIPKGTLLVSQPITGREMRRCAYELNKMSKEEKATANPEAIVRSLLERLFLSHIDKKDERDEIRTAMATWTSSKRPAA